MVRRPSRLRTLAALEPNAESSAEALDRIAGVACRVLDAPVVLVNLVGADRQRFVGSVGPERWRATREMLLTHGFCPFALGAEEAFAFADARVKDRIDASAACLLVLDESGQALRTAAAAGADPDVIPRMPLDPKLSLAQVMTSAQPDFLPTRPDVRERFAPILDVVPNVRSVALLPLTAGEQRLGVLGVCFGDERTLTTEVREYLVALAGVSSLALARVAD